MSDKTKEERELEESNILANKMILGEVIPDLVQSYRIVKNCIDTAILKGVFTAGDNALLVRAFDTLRNHINDVNNVEQPKEVKKTFEEKIEEKIAKKEEKKETKKLVKKEKVVEDTPVSNKPARKKRS